MAIPTSPSTITYQTKELFTDISSALVISVLEIFLAISFAALIFSGELTSFLSPGIVITLLGMAIIGFVIAGFSSLSGMIGGSQSVPVAIMAVMAAAIASEIPSGPSSSASFITIIVAIGITTCLTGLFFWTIGRFQLGGLIRFLPYPVAGGFLAASGWLLLTGAITMMADMPVSLSNLPQLIQTGEMARWLPGLFLAIIIFIAMRKSNHYLILPAFLASALLLFFFSIWISDLTLSDLAAEGWLLGLSAADTTTALPSLSLSFLGQIYWPAITSQTANIMAIIAVSTISMLLNAQGLELAIDCDLEINHELRIAGVANLLAGLTAGLVGYKQLSLSTLTHKLGSNRRKTGLIAALICLLAAFLGVTLLSYFPKILIGSLLLYLGITFLYEWVVEGLFTLPKIDYAIVLVILFVTMGVGFLEAVVLGLLLAVILFVVSYSQIDVIQHEMNGATCRSRVARSRMEEKLLIEHCHRVYILQLQGFIFFGTANNLLIKVRERIHYPQQIKPEFIVLDFKRVTGLDSTGLLSFKRMKQLLQKEDIKLLFTNPNPRVLDQLVNNGLDDDGKLVLIFPRLDLGAEFFENQILSSENDLRQKQLPLEQQLKETLFRDMDKSDGKQKIRSLLHYFERLEIDVGQYLIRAGDQPDHLYFIESGQLTAQLNMPGQAPVRLETSGSGSVFGEIGFYLGKERTADVIAETFCVVYRLSRNDLHQLEQSDPEAASTLHQIIAHLLAERLINKTESIRTLER